MRASCACFVLLCLLGCEVGAPDADGGIDAGHDAHVEAPLLTFLRDDQGGALFLRGTNIQGSSKWNADQLPEDYVDTEDFARLRDELGMNAIRFLIFWSAVEPEQGVYDAVYLAEVRRRIEAAADAGFFVVVDMHQDVFGVGFGGDGAPRWACDEALYASFVPPTAWYLGYFEPEVQACFDQLYADTPMRAAFGAMWRAVSTSLAGTRGLLAYELLNEPSWGSANAATFEIGIAPEAYAAWIDEIRAGDPDPYVIVPPASAANVGTPSSLVVPDRPRLIYGPHIYPPGLEGGFGWSGSVTTARRLTTQVRNDAIRMGLPVMVGELGARSEVDGAFDYLADIYTALDLDQLGATQWEGGHGGGYALFDDAGVITEVGLRVARPSPSRIAGTPREWSFDATARTFTLRWDEDANASGDTIVTLPTAVYPDGVDFSGVSGEVSGTLLRIPHTGEAARTVTITAR